eukprot:CAMPEP_0114654828 /NCGR_PEP_ID=MMETSP0191-20121206/10701_1 /TAXON_ID=126664 /ORGANISM="Sorites sp." /LENGTH=71 /DNA_ID=CAMNT_0001870367 /DNA_START=286 /DNA_END=498 /DNA_ORIENTATION=-
MPQCPPLGCPPLCLGIAVAKLALVPATVSVKEMNAPLGAAKVFWAGLIEVGACRWHAEPNLAPEQVGQAHW